MCSRRLRSEAAKDVEKRLEQMEKFPAAQAAPAHWRNWRIVRLEMARSRTL